MVKKIIATIMSCSMILSAIPSTVVFAAENKTSQEKIITNYQKSVELQNTNKSAAEYKVSTADELKDALEQIKKSTEEEATIVLTTDITLSRINPVTDREKEIVGGKEPEKALILGVADKNITFKSTENASYKLSLPGSLYLVGNVKIDNVKLYAPQTVYVNGFLLEITENAEGTMFKKHLYGGSDRHPVDSTHLILKTGNYSVDQYGNADGDGCIYGGGDSKGYGDSSGPSMSIDGNPSMPGYTPPAFNPGVGDVKGDVTIELGTVAVNALIGGGNNANVGGDVTITYNGGKPDLSKMISVFSGAGRSNQDGYGHVLGNVTLNLNSGMIKYIFGTGWTGDAWSSGIDAGKRHSVGKNLTINVGTDNGEKMRVLGHDYKTSLIACGNGIAEDGKETSSASVGGDINITLGKTALFQGWMDDEPINEITAVSTNSICYGTVKITNNGANIVNLNGIYQGGEILNQTNQTNALTMIYNNGKMTKGYIKPVYTLWPVVSKPAKIKGNTYIEVNGGNPKYVYGIFTKEQLQIDGDFNVEVNGGNIDYIYGGKAGEALTGGHKSTCIFKNGFSNKLLRLGNLDDVNVTDNSKVRVIGSNTEKPFKHEVKNITIDNGSTFAIAKSDEISGDLVVNGTLALPRKDKTDRTQPGQTVTLTVAGTATGIGKLQPVSSQLISTMLSDSKPVSQEEYVYAKNENSNMKLSLSKEIEGLFVDRKGKKDNQDVWFINEGNKPVEYLVNYRFESKNKDENLPKEIEGKLPKTGKVEHGKTATPSIIQFDDIKVKDGTWKFKGWNEEKFENVTSNVEFVGTWEFVKDSTGGGGTGGGTVTPPIKPEEPDRIEGGDRIETSVESSKDLYPNGTNAVVLANCERYTDVLTADPFAIQEKASALLTYKYELPEKTLKEIQRLGAKKIYISGGYDAVSKKVVDELAEKGYEIFRFDGVDRYDTARKIAIKIREKGNINVAELASGENYPDALCMTPLAVKDHAPILLTKKDSIPKYTKQALAEWDIENIKIGGLDEAVSKEVEKQLKSGFSIDKNKKKDSNIYDGAKVVKRIGGEDRYETSAKLAKESYPDSKLGVYATGEDFPDALIAGNYAGTKEAPVLLVKKDTLPEPIEKYTKESKIKKATIIGGVNAVSDKVLNLIKDAIRK